MTEFAYGMSDRERRTIGVMIWVVLAFSVLLVLALAATFPRLGRSPVAEEHGAAPPRVWSSAAADG